MGCSKEKMYKLYFNKTEAIITNGMAQKALFLSFNLAPNNKCGFKPIQLINGKHTLNYKQLIFCFHYLLLLLACNCIQRRHVYSKGLYSAGLTTLLPPLPNKVSPAKKTFMNTTCTLCAFHSRVIFAIMEVLYR